MHLVLVIKWFLAPISRMSLGFIIGLVGPVAEWDKVSRGILQIGTSVPEVKRQIKGKKYHRPEKEG